MNVQKRVKIRIGLLRRTGCARMGAALLAGSLFLAGCAEKKPGIDARTDMAIVRKALKKADRSGNPERRIDYLRTAYMIGTQLETQWPDARNVPLFMDRYSEELERIPQSVYDLALDARDMDSFQWAIARDAKVDLHYDALVAIWNMGKDWREYFIAQYPEESLSIFMSEAINDNSVRFFDQHIDAVFQKGAADFKMFEGRHDNADRIDAVDQVPVV